MGYPKIIAFLFISSTFIFLAGCHHEDDEPSGPQTLLTLQVDAEYGLPEDYWIFASDDEGKVLDAKPCADGQTITLVSDKRPDKIQVTFFRYNPSDGQTEISFNTWAAVASGTVLHFETLKGTPGDLKKSDATIRISNYPYNNRGLGISNGYSYSYQSSNYLGSLDLDLSFYGAPSDILLCGYASDVPAYHWANGVNANDVIELDFKTDFVPYPHLFKLDFEGVNTAIINGHDPKTDRYITLLDTYVLTSEGHPVIGYLDGFDSYRMNITNTKAAGKTMYYKVGDIDFSFKMPALTFSFVNNDIQNFSFNFSQNYTYHTISWDYVEGKEYTWWTINTPFGQPVKGLSIPSEIVAKYPQLDMKKFVYSSINFYQIISGRTYGDVMPGKPYTSQEGAMEYYIFSPR